MNEDKDLRRNLKSGQFTIWNRNTKKERKRLFMEREAGREKK
jgi:hypothetical protein